MTETAYQILFRGFDCLVAPTEEGHFDVSLFEEGAHVYTTDIPIDLSQFETEEEIDDNSSALIDEAAQAAVDEFEASRGSLGQGAGVGKMATKKIAYWSSMDYADWYCTLKATSFKDQAESLLEQYFSAQRDQSCGNRDQAQARRMAEEKLANLEYELNMLNLSRMKCAKPNETIIVIKAYRSDKEACGTLLEEFLDGFRGTKFEDSALAKMKEYLDVKKQLEGFYTEETKSLKQMFDIQEAMDELYVTALQQEVSDGVVDNSGVGADSNMAADVMSLMEGVTLDPMFEAQSEMPPALFANKRAQDFDPAEIMQYDSPLARKLFALPPDEELGGATEDTSGKAWYGLFRKEKAIVWEDDLATVHVQQFGSTDELAQMWERVKEEVSKSEQGVLAKRGRNRNAQDSAYMDEPSRPQDEVLQDALAMVKSMRKSDPATIKNTIKAVYGLSDKDASDLVSYGKRGKRAQIEVEHKDPDKLYSSDLATGDRVIHYKFGEGTVVNVDSSTYSISLVSVDFDKFEGRKEDRISRPAGELEKIGKRAQLLTDDGFDNVEKYGPDESANPYEDGYKAGLKGASPADNPYRTDTESGGESFDLWSKGLRDAKGKKSKRAEKEENDGEYEVVELGQIHEGIDPAEVPLKDFPFAIGDKVTLSKAFEMPIWGGGTTELAKGTKGTIKNLYDGHGDAYMVTCEEGSTYCIPTEYLK
jgi:hypothetical protein